MTKRFIGGLIVLVVGLFLSLMSVFSKGDGRFVWLFYGIPLLIIGFFILLNKNEDKIESIKGGK